MVTGSTGVPDTDLIANQFISYGIPKVTSYQLPRAIKAVAKECPAETAHTLVVWRGLTGQVLVEVQYKSQMTALQVKREIFAMTGIPVVQQQLFGFGGNRILRDDVLINTVSGLDDCDGIQIIVDAPPRHAWADICEQEVSVDDPEVGVDAPNVEFTPTEKSLHVARQKPKSHGHISTNNKPDKGSGTGRSEMKGKLQHHFILNRELQERDFNVLGRVKPRTKVIWQMTNVSLRLHGPGSGQQEEEAHLMLSVSAKRGDCDVCAFNQAIQHVKDLITSLNEQYRRFCTNKSRHVPELGLRCEAGYRRGSHKVR